MLKKKLIGLLASLLAITSLSSFVNSYEGESGGQGLGYSYSDIVCPRNQWAVVTTSINS